MTLFQMKWLRKLVRKNTNPIPFDTASTWKRRLSFGYAIIAWQAFGLVCYMLYKGKGDWAKYHGIKSEEDLRMTPAEHYSKMFNVNKAKVIRISGFEKIDEVQIDNSTKK
ncbi:uncharacterized protein LOC129611847 [Condylostylus longicornis]|uniref:uncharacterized protein LOC129611847 n=1 Tax=Condylostylus longicornis TaxID=2530218 RepID=UPI00244D9D1B|nr:uncharacterized protein LOC129611847 [Condylostylus longicornis]